MGYSVSVKFKNETEQENMHQFLLDNEDILNKMEQIELNNPLYLPCDNMPSVGENLGYAPNKKYLLGFHGTGIPEYIWDLCAWMSIKAGSKFKGQHYFYYDSEKQIVSFDIHNTKNTIVDTEGIPTIQGVPLAIQQQTIPTDMLFKFFVEKNETKKKQRELFIQLNNNWISYNLKNNFNKNKQKI